MFRGKVSCCFLIIFGVVTNVVIATGSYSCSRCPGQYCGRMTLLLKDDQTSICDAQCGKCERGYRTDFFVCNKCEQFLTLYDWLFLGFMVLSVTVLNFNAIDKFHSSERKSWLYHFSALIESVIAVLCTILYFEPTGELRMYSCGVKSIRDFYTLFYNPKLQYMETIRCTQEAVYPLFTSVLLYLVFCLFTMTLFRGIILQYGMHYRNSASLYAGFYIIPIIGVIHVCFAGVLYYVYPYLVLFLSAIGVAVFLSNLDEDVVVSVRKPRVTGILICFCIAHAYGIVSITEMLNPVRDCIVMLLVFLPVSFYVLAKPFTIAENFKA